VLRDNRSSTPWRGKLAIAPGLLLIMVLLAACGGTVPSTTVPTPTPITVQFTTLDLGLPQQALSAPIVGTVPDATILHVGITFKINSDQLNRLGKNGQGKVSTGPTDASTVVSNLGIDDATYEKIKAYFGIENATLKLSTSHTNLDVDAKAGSFAQLLQTRFVLHKLNGRTFYTPDPARPPKIPTFIANTILAVTGLDNYSLPPNRNMAFNNLAQQQQAHTSTANANCKTTPNVVRPQAVAQAYGYNQVWSQGSHGENMTVNLVEIDGFNKNDVNNYFSCVGFQGKLDTVTIDGSAPPAGGETTLDIEMLAGLAPSLHIIDIRPMRVRLPASTTSGFASTTACNRSLTIIAAGPIPPVLSA
jgi:kumamolisin